MTIRVYFKRRFPLEPTTPTQYYAGQIVDLEDSFANTLIAQYYAELYQPDKDYPQPYEFLGSGSNLSIILPDGSSASVGGGGTNPIALTSSRNSTNNDSGGSPIYNATTSNYTFTVVAGTITQPTYFQQEDTGTITLVAGSGVTFLGANLTTAGDGSILSLIPEISMPNSFIVSLSSAQNPLVTQDEGLTVSGNTATLNFTGAGVMASGSGANVTVNIPGTVIPVQDEGNQITPSVSSFNFVGAGVTATASGNAVTVTVNGGGGSAIAAQDEGLPVESALSILNFVGAGVTASSAGAGNVTVSIPGGGGGASLTNTTETYNTTAPNDTVPVEALSATGAATNIDYAIVPKGTGAFLLDIPDNQPTGGNKRGANAIDLQTARLANSQVANGNAAVAIGTNNTASASQCVSIGTGNNTSGSQAHAIGASNTVAGTGAFASGISNSATGAYSSLLGRNGVSNNIQGQVTFGHNGTTQGQAQTSFTGLRQTTTNATATRATADAAAAAATNQLTLRNNSAFKFLGRATAIDTVSIDAKEWEFSGLIKRLANAGTTVLVGSPTVTSTFADAAAAAWVLALSADTGNGSLAVTVTGEAGKTIRWNIEIMSVEAA